MTYSDYTTYFEDLFKNHEKVCHEDDKGKHTFMCINWDEIDKFRSDMRPHSYAISLLTPDIRYTSDENDNCCEIWDGAIQITHWHGTRKVTITRKEAMNRAKEVMKQVIQRVVSEGLAGESIFEGCKIRKCQDFVQNIVARECVHGGNYSGWLLQFRIAIVDNSLSPDCTDITSVWKDLV